MPQTTDERAFLIKDVRVTGLGGGKSLGNDAEALQQASEMLRKACDRSPRIPFLDIYFTIVNNDGDGPEQEACLTITDNELFLTVPASGGTRSKREDSDPRQLKLGIFFDEDRETEARLMEYLRNMAEIREVILL